MQAEWSVQTFPLGMCRYDRAVVSDATAEFRVRFHVPIAFALGFLAARHSEGPGDDSREKSVTVVLSDDAQLIPALADARQSGVDARLAWFSGSLSPEVSHFCGRNGVPVLLIDPVMVTNANVQSNRPRDYGLSYLTEIAGAKQSRK
jgi:hypothetical protein